MIGGIASIFNMPKKIENKIERVSNTEYKPEYCKQLLDFQKCSDGKKYPCVELFAICTFHAERSTIIKWAKEHPEFLRALVQAKETYTYRMDRGSPLDREIEMGFLSMLSNISTLELIDDLEVGK